MQCTVWCSQMSNDIDINRICLERLYNFEILPVFWSWKTAWASVSNTELCLGNHCCYAPLKGHYLPVTRCMFSSVNMSTCSALRDVDWMSVYRLVNISLSACVTRSSGLRYQCHRNTKLIQSKLSLKPLLKTDESQRSNVGITQRSLYVRTTFSPRL